MDTTDYYYDPHAGEGISVYIVDTGVYTGNSEFTNLPGGYRWIWPTQDFWKDSSDVPYQEVDNSEHGTCLMSKVVGKRFGVAKKASTVIAKWIYGAPISWQVLVLEIITRVRKDILTKALQGKAVINMSFGQPSDDQEYIAALEAVLTDLVRELDVVVVISAGYIEVSHKLTMGFEHQLGEIHVLITQFSQEGGSSYINEYPALIRKTLPDLIVVGSVNVDGSRSSWSQTGPLVGMYIRNRTLLDLCCCNSDVGIQNFLLHIIQNQ